MWNINVSISSLMIMPTIVLLTLICTAGYMKMAARYLVDMPNHRSLHTVPVPRGGGIVFIGIWLLLQIIYLFSHHVITLQYAILLVSTASLAIVSFIDDRYHLSAKLRFLVHWIVAIAAVWALDGAPIFAPHGIIFWGSIVTLLLTAFCIVWSINLFNFMDGMDGLAAMEAVIVLTTIAFVCWQVGAQLLALSAVLLVSSVLGFLVWNKPPAKLFMGDVGSATLGFIIALYILMAHKYYAVPLSVLCIVYSFFGFDASMTLLRRIIGKERWYEAHASHAYQRLYRQFGAVRTLLVSTGVNVVLASLALFVFFHPSHQLLGLLCALSINFIYYLGVERINPFSSSALTT